MIPKNLSIFAVDVIIIVVAVVVVVLVPGILVVVGLVIVAIGIVIVVLVVGVVIEVLVIIIIIVIVVESVALAATCRLGCFLAAAFPLAAAFTTLPLLAILARTRTPQRALHRKGGTEC